jgi:hypothetical protein
MDRSAYPKDWKRRVQARRQHVGDCCERCGVPHGALRISQKTGLLYVVYLQGCHPLERHGDPEADVLALCQSCHNQYDASYRAQRRRKKTQARLDMPLVSFE